MFPLAHQVVCRWHVNQNILKKCKRHFSDGKRWEQIQARWNDLCKSRSAKAFEDSWTSLKNEFADIPVVVSYLDLTWIKHKEKIADAWVGKRLHLGCSTTSRAESSNAFIKRFLSSSGGDLLTVFQELNLAINRQVSELAKTHADDSFKRYFFTTESIYTDVAGKVSNYALLQAFDHRQTRIGTECSGHFSTTMGISCAHKQNERNQNNQKLSLSDFHEQWHVKGPSDNLATTNLATEPTPEDLISTLRAQYDAAPPHKKLELIEQVRIIINNDTSSMILEPLPVRVKGRPEGATAKLHSTKRDPSGFEYVSGSKQLQRQCSKCKLFGHNTRTCSTKISL